MGITVDLDDPNILGEDHVCNKMSAIEIFRECEKELGYALLYMNFYHTDIKWTKQKKRVHKLCEELSTAKDAQYTTQDLKSFLYRIHDEIENMC